MTQEKTNIEESKLIDLYFDRVHNTEWKTLYKFKRTYAEEGFFTREEALKIIEERERIDFEMEDNFNKSIQEGLK